MNFNPPKKNIEQWALYFHIPFCERKCGYCDFFSVANYERQPIRRYFSYLEREYQLFTREFEKRNARISSIYFGGGTPSYVPADNIVSLLSIIGSTIVINEDTEITIEVNPSSAITRKFEKYSAAGINRISIGIQSLIPSELDQLERIHTVTEAVETFNSARNAGFDNISVDLIFGIPGQTPNSWYESILGILELKPEHISAYSLTPEPGTPMYEVFQNGRLSLPVDELSAELFFLSQFYFKSAGYSQYEVSNFALNNREARHNSHYWSKKQYKGFGVSAHSFFDNIRSWNTKDFDEYYSRLDAGETSGSGSEQLTDIQRMNETIMLSLRTSEGLSLSKFKAEFGAKTTKELMKKVSLLAENDYSSFYFKDSGSVISLSSRGLFLSDEIISRLLFDGKEESQLNLIK